MGPEAEPLEEDAELTTFRQRVRRTAGRLLLVTLFVVVVVVVVVYHFLFVCLFACFAVGLSLLLSYQFLFQPQ